MDDRLNRVRDIGTMAEFGAELRQRRFQAGFDKLPQLLRSIKDSRFSLPTSTAYDLEKGAGGFDWVRAETYLRACGAADDELIVWREAHHRATDDRERRRGQEVEEPRTPTASQLAELGPEAAARLLGEIDPTAAADLLRRIDLKQAVVVVPELTPDVAVELIGLMSRARAILLFENIAPDRGAELLTEFPAEDAANLLDDLDTRRVAELVAAMPRGRAARLLRGFDRARTLRLLTEMRAKDAARLLSELDQDVLTELVTTAPAQKAADILRDLDRDLVADLMANGVSESRAVELLTLAVPYVGSSVFQRMDEADTRRLLARMPAASLGPMLDGLSADLQTSLLADLLAPADAAATFARCSGEGFTVRLDWLSPSRVAAMIDAAGPPEGVLWLACSRGRTAVLDALPETRAAYFAAQSTPERLAEHLAELDPHRGSEYLIELDRFAVPADELLALMTPETAVALVLSYGDFKDIARWVRRLPLSHVHEFLRVVNPGEIAHILSYTDLDFVTSALSDLAAPTVARILNAIADRVTFRNYDHRDLSDAEFAALCDQRRAELAELRRRLGRAGQPSAE